MTAKVIRASGQYFSAPDSAALTFPNSDWTLAGLVVFDGLTTGDNGQYMFSTGGYTTSGALNVLYQTAGNAAQPSTICFTRSTDSGVRASTSKFLSGDAVIWVLHHTNGMLTMRTCRVRSTPATDGSSVVLENSDQPLTTALDGPSGLFLGARADLAANRFTDQSIGRFFRYDGLLTDLEVEKLAYGMEITDLGKTPAWYIRLDTASDTQDRGTIGLTVTPKGTGTIATGTAPAFGYTGQATPSTPSISAAPMTAERIYQRIGTSRPIPMSGTWQVTKPTSIEYQLYAENGTTVLMPWAQISGATINDDGSWSGSPDVPQGGMYRRQVRAKSGSNVIATGTIESNLFGVGDLFGHTGSSSSSLLFTNESGTGFTPSANIRVYHNSNTTWARFGTDGAAIAMANILAAKAGVPVGFIAYGWGGTTLAQWLDKTGPRWTRVSASVAANGGKLACGITTVGSNDANDGIVVSRVSHTTNLRQFITNHRDLTGQPNLPILNTGYNRRPSANAQQSDWVRQSESIVGDDPNVYHVQVVDLELYSDLTHLSRTNPGGFRYSAERGGNVLGDAIYNGIYRRGPKITGISYTGNKVSVDLDFRNNGTDFIPATGINGFTVSDSSGAALSFSVARESAKKIAITCNRDLTGTVTVKYLSGSSPVSSTAAAPTNEVFDNGTMALPMTVETEMPVTYIAPEPVTPTVTGVTISPTSATIAGGSSQQFSATVTGTNSPSQSVTWSATAGTINSSGLFTAPASTGSAQSITVTATSSADNSKSAPAVVTIPAVVVTPTVSSVTVSPSTVTLAGGGSQQFAAPVFGTTNPSQAVAWPASAVTI